MSRRFHHRTFCIARFPTLRVCGLRLVVLLVLASGGVQAQQVRGLPDYRREVADLVGAPGVSYSLAAGLYNPAAWPIQLEGGALLSLRDVADSDARDWTAILSARGLAFAWRRFNFDAPPAAGGRDGRIDEFTLGLGGGSPGGAFGLSYSWSDVDSDFAERHRRLDVGQISRWRWLSVGAAAAFDLQSDDNYYEADLGLRPFGPRLTLFADAVYNHGESFEDITTG